MTPLLPPDLNNSTLSFLPPDPPLADLNDILLPECSAAEPKAEPPHTLAAGSSAIAPYPFAQWINITKKKPLEQRAQGVGLLIRED